MQALIGLFKPMGADSACSDCARVFRMPETTNLKSGRQVCILNGSLVRYNFDDLSDSIFIASGRPTRREIQARKKPAKKDRVPKSKRGLSPRVRFAMISRDLEKIVAHWGGTVPKGHRNTYLHLVATCLTHAEVAAELETEILCIAHQVAPSLKRREVLAIVKSAESYAARATSSNPVLDGRLHYSGARIAELLDITDELACDLGLTQIYSNRERRRRKAVREKSRRKSRGTCSRGDWLSKNSTSREKPWEGLGISRSTWYAKGYHKHNKTP